MLLDVRRRGTISRALCTGLLGLTLAATALAQASPGGTAQSNPATQDNAASAPAPGTSPPQATAAPLPPRVGLSMVVLDPAHGGTDLGARGTEGIRESDVVLLFAARVKKSLEFQGFQVIQTRDANDNPSFDDRSARVNAQRGAVFITLHVASTGLAGTAQAPFVGLSKKLGDLVQAELAKRFKGSPTTALVAPVRQLRTTAAPAIAVEISSVSVADRAELDRMVPGIADAIARGVSEFKLSYVVPTITSPGGGTQP
jgi:N-acetylmuramoyl-L-alanine amidase